VRRARNGHGANREAEAAYVRALEIPRTQKEAPW